ncbi:MoaD/ThiS family protein [Lewinella cohaerens]|uniref:MoaD/ThiS family protein n=1 Tax=Lewinella cohaerens TaxID=70995 RepID=UPI000382F263|nr:MoaD/ThiS family protein [Lewinella cohaerens]
MEIKVLAFGIARDILGGPELKISGPENLTVGRLLELLKERYPAFVDLTSLAIAVNAEYANENQPISAGDEIVIIPPVAGG